MFHISRYCSMNIVPMLKAYAYLRQAEPVLSGNRTTNARLLIAQPLLNRKANCLPEFPYLKNKDIHLNDIHYEHGHMSFLKFPFIQDHIKICSNL